MLGYEQCRETKQSSSLSTKELDCIVSTVVEDEGGCASQ